ASYDVFRVRGKVHRMTTHPAVKTIPDQIDERIPATQVNGEALMQVKSIVAEYLPGADMAGMRFLNQTTPNGEQSTGARNGSTGKKHQPGGSSRMVVTVSKRVQSAEHTHLHIMRMTLDEEGKAVKLS